VRSALRLGLEDEGYEVFEAANGEDALVHHQTHAPEVLLVDLMLGGMTGFDLIRTVRQTDDLPIIVVSARVDTHDIVAGLEAGADDYVTKPFQVKEVAARIRALLRRSRRTGDSTGPSGDDPGIVLDARQRDQELILDPRGGRLMRGSTPVHLTLTEFRLLCELAAEPGRVLSRSQLLDRDWEHGFFGDERLVDVHVRRLRTKIEADPSEPTMLVTVRGLGYRLDLR
jgi:DNA-binding response OmpR family regulator